FSFQPPCCLLFCPLRLEDYTMNQLTTKAEAGLCAVIPYVSCLYMQNELVLHWFYTGRNLNVHSFYQNQDQLGDQNQLYRNRTFLFKDQFPRNNLSLLITGVKPQDEGRYKCFRSSTKGFRETNINLNIDGREGVGSPRRPQRERNPWLRRCVCCVRIQPRAGTGSSQMGWWT
uniref:Ig-like domain-containing protein n=1 Tax=Xiphophorus couchianus TaxID=32473 RepID=A0A3B5LMK9_9TELE